jgi:hypothetical protein
VEALLDVASHPEDAICSMSFNFWHRLARALTIGLHPEPLGEHHTPVLPLLMPQPLKRPAAGSPAPFGLGIPAFMLAICSAL